MTLSYVGCVLAFRWPISNCSTSPHSSSLRSSRLGEGKVDREWDEEVDGECDGKVNRECDKKVDA